MYYLIRNEDYTDEVASVLDGIEGLEGPMPFQDDNLGDCQLVQHDDLEDYLSDLEEAAGVPTVLDGTQHEGITRIMFAHQPAEPIHPTPDESVAADPFVADYALDNQCPIVDGHDLMTVLHGMDLYRLIEDDFLVSRGAVDNLERFNRYLNRTLDSLRDRDVDGYVSPILVSYIWGYFQNGYDDREAARAVSHLAARHGLHDGLTRNDRAYPSEVQLVPTAVMQDLNEDALPPPATELGRVHIDTWSSDQSRQMRPRMQTFLEPYVDKLGAREIHVRVPHGTESTPVGRSDEVPAPVFFVDIWTAPRHGRNPAYPMSPSHVLGVPVGLVDLALSCEEPEGDGWSELGYVGPLTDPETGFVYAHLFENQLFITFDAVHVYHQDTFAMMERIMDVAVETLASGEGGREERRRQAARRRTERAQEAYVRWAGERDREALNNALIEQEANNNDIESLSTRLTSALRRRPILLAQVTALRTATPNNGDSYRKEFDKLLESDKVIEVRFDNGVLQVFTDDLFAQHSDRGSWHHIGRFSLSIQENGTLRFSNLTHQIDGYNQEMQAPHVFNNGRACYGNLEEIMPALAASREYASIAFMGIAFLETANLRDDAGRYLTRWPEVSEAVAKGQRPIVYLNRGEEPDDDEDHDGGYDEDYDEDEE